MKIFSGLFSILLLVGYWTCNTVAANAEWTKINLGQAYENADIYDVWGTSGADLFAVGMNFEEGKWDDRYGLIIHYDGTIWHAMEGPNAKWLYCVWGSSSSDIFAGGEEVDGTFGGAILHFDGAAWTEMDHPNFSGNWVDDIWGTSASDVYAVGAGRILHYDGASWTTSYESTDPFFFHEHMGKFRNGRICKRLFLEGDVENYAILHYDGSQWREMATGPGGRLLNLWGSSGTDVFAVGYPGIIHFDGTAWTKMNGISTAPQEYVYAVWGNSASNVFAGGLDGHIHHYDGTSWTDMQISNTQALWNIWGRQDMYAVGNGACFFHYADTIPEPPVLNITTSGINVKAAWTQAINVPRTILSYAPYPFTGMQSIVAVDMGTKTSLSIDLWEGAAFYVAVQAANSFGTSDISNIELFVLGP